jgi:hypothetical protein
MSEGPAGVSSYLPLDPALPLLRRGNRMAVDEGARHKLRQRLQEVLGAEEAGTLMASLPPVGYAELATKTDLSRLEERLELKIDAAKQELRAEMQELRAEMQKMGRSLMLSFITVMAVMNGLLFAALQLS